MGAVVSRGQGEGRADEARQEKVSTTSTRKGEDRAIQSSNVYNSAVSHARRGTQVAHVFTSWLASVNSTVHNFS